MSDPDFRKIGRWTLMFAVLAALSLTAAITVGRRSMRMSSAMAAAADPSGFTQLAPGTAAQVVIEVTSVSPKQADGKLLEREQDDLYKRTGEPVDFTFVDATPVVMGKMADLHPGAVVHVKGTVASDHRIQAQQIVILTGYVKVQ